MWGIVQENSITLYQDLWISKMFFSPKKLWMIYIRFSKDEGYKRNLKTHLFINLFPAYRKSEFSQEHNKN